MADTYLSGVLRKIQSEYKTAGTIQAIEEVAEGHQSHNFILADEENRFFLKQYRFDDRNRVKEIHRAKFFFHQGGIPIILPLKNKNGSSVLEVEQKLYALFPFVEGKIIKRVGRSKEAFASAGKMLGKIHILSRDNRSPQMDSQAHAWNKDKFLNSAEIIKKKILAQPKRTPFDELALKTLKYKVCIAKNNNIRYEDFDFRNDHLIHGDYHGGNIFYNDDNEVGHIFDLENAKMSPHTLEVARAIDYMCFSEEYGPENFRAARTFIEAYNTIYPLDNKELSRGIKSRFLDIAHSSWREEEHYLKGNNRFDCFFAGELEMLRYNSKNCDKLIKELTN